MAKKNYYENSFQLSRDDDKEKEINNRIDMFKSTKKEIIYQGKDNANYEVFETKNPKKDYGKNRYFIDRGDGTSIGIYKVKKNAEPYSRFRNSELVYGVALNRNTPFEMKDGKRVSNWREQGVIEKN